MVDPASTPSMSAHSPSPTWIERLQARWKRIFFWQSIPPKSREQAPLPSTDQLLVAHITKPSSMPRVQQLRYLSHVFSERERRQFWIALLAGICFLGISTAFFAEPHLYHQATTGGLWTEGLVGSPKWINPVLAPLNDVDRDLSQLVFSGLYRYEGTSVKEDLAATTLLLDGGKTLEIHLREDALFHDNTPVTADDVAFTINDAIKNPAWHSPLADAFKNITAIRIDDQTVQIKNTDTALPLDKLKSLLTVGILPAHRWVDANDGSPQLAEENLKPVGSGPYRFETYTRDVHGTILTYTLKRFAGYYGQTPFIEERGFRFYGDRKGAEAAIESNQIDALAFVPWSEASRLRVTDAKTIQIDLPQVATLFFNTQDALLKDQTIRTALQLAIDRGELAKQIGHITPLQTPFPLFETYSTSTQLTNIDEARRLLDDARWKLDETTGERFLQPAPSVVHSAASRSRTATTVTTTAPFSTSIPLKISLLAPSQGDLPLVADYLKRRWSLLGASVTVELLDRDQIMQRALTNHTAQAILLNVLVQNDTDLLTFWRKSDNDLNFSQWSSPTIVSAFQSLSAATSTDAAIQARTTITNTILNQEAAVFLFRPSYAYVIGNTIQGAQNLLIQGPADRLPASASWYLNTRLRWKRAP